MHVKFYSLFKFSDSTLCIIYSIPVTNPPVRKIGSVADIDPVNEYYGSLTPAMNNNHVTQHQPPPPPPTSGVIVSLLKFKFIS